MKSKKKSVSIKQLKRTLITRELIEALADNEELRLSLIREVRWEKRKRTVARRHAQHYERLQKKLHQLFEQNIFKTEDLVDALNKQKFGTQLNCHYTLESLNRVFWQNKSLADLRREHRERYRKEIIAVLHQLRATGMTSLPQLVDQLEMRDMKTLMGNSFTMPIVRNLLYVAKKPGKR